MEHSLCGGTLDDGDGDTIEGCRRQFTNFYYELLSLTPNIIIAVYMESIYYYCVIYNSVVIETRYSEICILF